jgi:hypothetical protein
MSVVKNLAIEIENEIFLEDLTYLEIARKYDIPYDDVIHMVDSLVQDEEYPDPDVAYDDRYCLEDF